MGRRGPQPKPTALRILNGNPSGRPINKKEPTPKRGVPPCPDWLDDLGKDCWRWLVEQLGTLGLLSMAEANTMARYCDLWSNWRQATAVIREKGFAYPIKTKDGRLKYLQPFPQVSIANRATIELRRLEQEFGLTPASRTRLTTDKPVDDTDDIAEFLHISSGRK